MCVITNLNMTLWHTSFADDFPICQGTFQDLFVFRVDLLIGQGPRHVAPGDAEHLRGAACGQDLGAGTVLLTWKAGWNWDLAKKNPTQLGVWPKSMGWNWDLAKNCEMKLGFSQKLWDEIGILPKKWDEIGILKKNAMKLGFWPWKIGQGMEKIENCDDVFQQHRLLQQQQDF